MPRVWLSTASSASCRSKCYQGKLPGVKWTYGNTLLRHATRKVAALRISTIRNGAELIQYDQFNILIQGRRVHGPSHPAGQDRITACYLQKTSDWIVGPDRGRRLASDQSLSFHETMLTVALVSTGVRDISSVLLSGSDCGLPCTLALTPNFTHLQKAFRRQMGCQVTGYSNKLTTIFFTSWHKVASSTYGAFLTRRCCTQRVMQVS